MVKKVFYLATCSTCKRIITELGIKDKFELQNTKEKPVSEEELEKLHQFAGSYESLFNRRSTLYRDRKLKEQVLSEEDYKNLILEHYSFIKRPIIQVDDHFFIGNSKKTIQAAKEFIDNLS